MIAFAYPPRPSDIEFLSSHPFEHHWRYSDPSRFVQRIETERSLYESAGAQGVSGFCLLVIVVRNSRSTGPLANTLRSVALQSCPEIQCSIWSDDPEWDNQAIEGFQMVGTIPSTFELYDSVEGDWSADGRFVCFVHSGDLLHPSFAHSIALCASTDNADVIVWNDIDVRGDARRPRSFSFVRRPALERYTLWHSDYIGRSFAVRTCFLERYSSKWFSEARAGNYRNLQLWLAQQPDVHWEGVFDFLAIRNEADDLAPQRFPAADPKQSAELHREYCAEFEWRTTAHQAQPHVLVPTRRPSKLSVVIPFRDKPDLTIESALSVLSQKASFPIALILVNNQSAASSVRTIREALESTGFRDRYRIVDYDEPFNHSAQCNLGATRSDAEVVIFLNNDARFVGDSSIEEMGRWALLPDVATVGVRIDDESGALSCAGLQLRLASRWHDSPFEESVNPLFADRVRETAGNTFAVVAIESRKLAELGWLDATCFPNGFNDVDFCLRARRAGYVHLYLGHLRAVHAKGQSRSRIDEMPEKVRVRRRHPETGVWALSQLAVDIKMEQLSARQHVGAWAGYLVSRLRRGLRVRG